MLVKGASGHEWVPGCCRGDRAVLWKPGNCRSLQIFHLAPIQIWHLLLLFSTFFCRASGPLCTWQQTLKKKQQEVSDLKWTVLHLIIHEGCVLHLNCTNSNMATRETSFTFWLSLCQSVTRVICLKRCNNAFESLWYQWNYTNHQSKYIITMTTWSASWWLVLTVLRSSSSACTYT